MWNKPPRFNLEVTREMSVITPKDSPAVAAGRSHEEHDAAKVRCLCGKWWAYRTDDALVLQCKLCRREIVITGENLTIEYR